MKLTASDGKERETESADTEGINSGRYCRGKERETMKTFEEIKETIQEHKEEFQQQYGLKEIGIFGSYARGEQNEESDVDILIELERPIGFVKFIRIENALSGILGTRVELVTKKALKPYIGKRILSEVKYV